MKAVNHGFSVDARRTLRVHDAIMSWIQSHQITKLFITKAFDRVRGEHEVRKTVSKYGDTRFHVLCLNICFHDDAQLPNVLLA